MKAVLLRILTVALLCLLVVACVTACGDKPSGTETDTNKEAESSQETETQDTTETDKETDKETESQTEEPVHTHTEEILPGKAATCTETGLTEGKKCSVCGEILVKQEVIPAKGHTYENGACKDCGAKEPIPSEGLEFTLNDDGESYIVSGIGACKDTNVVIPSTYNGQSVVNIGKWAFKDCSSLKSIVIPDSVTNIDEWAFFGCSGLTNVEISDSVTNIDKWAFKNCSGLKSIVIPDGVTSIGFGAFSDCHNLTGITVTEGNPVYHSNGNCLIETSGKRLIAGCKNSVIPDDGSVTSIGDWAFYGCGSLTNITIPDSVTSIGNQAFCDCSGLKSITIPDSVTGIDEQAFSGCTGLTSIVVSGSVTHIGAGAFCSCSSLTSITFTGTKAQWNQISKGSDWNYGTGSYVIHCTDGDIQK